MNLFNSIKTHLVNHLPKIVNRSGKVSYSQSGEDLIVDYIMSGLKISQPSYLDIGAHHPIALSNTYLFYQKGCKGVCIEPDPLLHSQIKKTRKRDICLNVGAGISHETSADFFVMTSKTLNTFSRDEAERYQKYKNQKIEHIIQVPLIPINEIISDYFSFYPNFISLDVEGLDFAILQSLDFKKYRPEVFCVETLTYTEDNTETKIQEIIEFMISKGYMAYADTYINTIFVEENIWKNR